MLGWRARYSKGKYPPPPSSATVVRNEAAEGGGSRPLLPRPLFPSRRHSSDPGQPCVCGYGLTPTRSPPPTHQRTHTRAHAIAPLPSSPIPHLHLLWLLLALCPFPLALSISFPRAFSTAGSVEGALVAVGNATKVAPTSPQYLIDCMGKINMHPFDQHDPNLCAPLRDYIPYRLYSRVHTPAVDPRGTWDECA